MEKLTFTEKLVGKINFVTIPLSLPQKAKYPEHHIEYLVDCSDLEALFSAVEDCARLPLRTWTVQADRYTGIISVCETLNPKPGAFFKHTFHFLATADGKIKVVEMAHDSISKNARYRAINSPLRKVIEKFGALTML